MAGLRFSHLLLILALTTWLLCIIINLFFPFILYVTPVFFGSLSSILANPTAIIVDHLPATRQDTLAMICFLLAIACSFVAGAVYGMEREGESVRYNLNEWSAANVLEADNNDWNDLEKGGLPPYTPYRDDESINEYSEKTSATTAGAGEPPHGDAMTGAYYDSASDYQHAVAQVQAQANLIIQNRTNDADFIRPSNIHRFPFIAQAGHPLTGVASLVPRPTPRSGPATYPVVGIVSYIPPPPPTSRLRPATFYVQGSYSGMNATSGKGVTKDDLYIDFKYASAVCEGLPEVELFSIYTGEDQDEGLNGGILGMFDSVSIL